MHIAIPTHHRSDLLFRALLHINPNRPMLVARGGAFARNVNVAVNASFADGAEHVLVMNDDVVIDDEQLGTLAAEDGDIVYPAIQEDSVPRLRGDRLELRRVVGVNMALVEGDEGTELDIITIAAPDEPWIPHFACTRVSRKAWETCGPLCEEYVNGWEDVEFLLKCRKEGLLFRFARDVEIVHDEYASRFVFDHRGNLLNSAENRAVFMRRCAPLLAEMLSEQQAEQAPAEGPEEPAVES